MSQHLRIATAALVLGLLAAGCGDDRTEPGDQGGTAGAPAADGAWRTSTDPVDPSGLVWLTGTTVHLADGSTIELEEPTEEYVVAGDGVFTTVYDDEGARTIFTAADGTSEDTGLGLMAESLQASPDGRYLAGVSRTLSDEEDQFDTPLATVVVFDLETGEQLVSSTEGMGDTGSDDLLDLYSETEIGGLAFVDDDTVVAETTDDERAYDLDTGEAREPEAGEEIPTMPVVDSPEVATSPDGAWRIAGERPLAETLEEVDGGRVVTPRTGSDRWALDFWLDDTTTVGVVVDGPGGPRRVGPGDELTMLTCTVPSGECRRYDETTGTDVTFPQRAGAPANRLLLSGEPS